MIVQRWPGKPTSGRYVYRVRGGGGWYWQCAMHPEDECRDYYAAGAEIVPTMQEAFAGALAHAKACYRSNSQLRRTQIMDIERSNRGEARPEPWYIDEVALDAAMIAFHEDTECSMRDSMRAALKAAMESMTLDPPVRVYYRSFTADGRLWTESRDPVEVAEHAEGVKGITFDRIAVYEESVREEWSPAPESSER